MNGQEFATAVQYDLPIIVLVDRGMYVRPSACIRSGNIPAAFRRRLSGTPISPPTLAPLAAMAKPCATLPISPGFRTRCGERQAGNLHCFLDPEAITPTRTLSEIRGGDEKTLLRTGEGESQIDRHSLSTNGSSILNLPATLALWTLSRSGGAMQFETFSAKRAGEIIDRHPAAQTSLLPSCMMCRKRLAMCRRRSCRRSRKL